MKMDKNKMVKIAGIAGTVLSVGATVLSSWTEEQKLNQKVEEKVNEILSQKLCELNK